MNFELPEPPESAQQLHDDIEAFRRFATRFDTAQDLPQIERYQQSPNMNRQSDRELYANSPNLDESDFDWGDEWYRAEQRAVLRDAMLLMITPIVRPFRLLQGRFGHDVLEHLERAIEQLYQYIDQLGTLSFDGDRAVRSKLDRLQSTGEHPQPVKQMWREAFSSISDGQAGTLFLNEAVAVDEFCAEQTPGAERLALQGIIQFIRALGWAVQTGDPTIYPIIDRAYDISHRMVERWAGTSPHGTEFRSLLDELPDPDSETVLPDAEAGPATRPDFEIKALLNAFVSDYFADLLQRRQSFFDDEQIPPFLYLQQWGLVETVESAARLRQYYLDIQLLGTGYFNNRCIDDTVWQQVEDIGSDHAEEPYLGSIIRSELLPETAVSDTALNGMIQEAIDELDESHIGQRSGQASEGTQAFETAYNAQEASTMDDELTPPDAMDDDLTPPDDGESGEYSQREETILEHINSFQEYLQSVGQRGELVEPADLIDRLERMKEYLTDYFDSHLNEQEFIQEGDPAALADILHEISEDDVDPAQQLVSFIQAETQPEEEEALLDKLNDEQLRRLEFVIAHRFGRDNPIASYREQLEEQYRGDDA